MKRYIDMTDKELDEVLDESILYIADVMSGKQQLTPYLGTVLHGLIGTIKELKSKS